MGFCPPLLALSALSLAGLTSKPHHAPRSLSGLRGSFCLRLASTFNHRPDAPATKAYYIPGAKKIKHVFSETPREEKKTRQCRAKKRRCGDSNPSTGRARLPDFESGPFNRLGTSPCQNSIAEKGPFVNREREIFAPLAFPLSLQTKPGRPFRRPAFQSGHRPRLSIWTGA